MRRVFKTRHFSRWLRKSEVTDAVLCAAVDEMQAGLIDAELGGDVVKKRVALPGRGKRGGARTLVATRKGSRWFFVFGFEKNERSNRVGSLANTGQRAVGNEFGTTGYRRRRRHFAGDLS